MNNKTSVRKYPEFCEWDIDKYQSNYPPEYWNLCRLFMIYHKTKYPEARLAQLTEAFYNMGVHGRFSDPKIDRMAAALSVPVIEHFLHFHPGTLTHPYHQKTSSDALDSGAPSFESTAPRQRHNLQHLSGRVRLDEQKLEISTLSSSSLEGGVGLCGSQSSSFKHIQQQQFTSQESRSSTQDKKMAQKRSSDMSKSEFDLSESKRNRITPTNERLTERKLSSVSENKYILKRLIDLHSVKTMLIGFVIIRDVMKDSILSNDVQAVEDSFKRSKFGLCTWHFDKINNSENLRVKLQLGDVVLVEAEGGPREFLQQQTAQAFLKRMESFSPTIKGSNNYYNDGKCRELPEKYPKGPCLHFLNSSLNNMKQLIGDFAERKDFLEVILMYPTESPEVAAESMQNIIELIENELGDQLRYRLANFFFQGKNCPAICVSYVHGSLELLKWLEEHDDQRYSVTFNNFMKVEFWKAVEEKKLIAPSDNPHAQMNKTHVEQTKTNVESSISKQPPNVPLTTVRTIRNEKSDKLQWVGKEHLPTVGHSVYLVKPVTADSKTESDPFKLLSATCSPAFDLEIKYAMKQCPDKSWTVSVVMKHDQGNILVGEARSANCADARLAAAQDAVNTIQTRCRVVEPNFNYFAEGGVPSFISLKTPLKTSTYEIMVMDTNANPVTQEVVKIILEMIAEEKNVEDIFFLASDFTNKERDLIRKSCSQYGLGWRLFGLRDRFSSPEDILSTQHLCVFHPKSPVQIVQQLIISGGSTVKYSIVNRNNHQDDESQVTLETPTKPPSEPKETCRDETYLGGCVNRQCSLDHINILDCIVNQFLEIRSW